jgi:hypothetical protein
VQFPEHVKKNLQARVFANYLSLASHLPTFLPCYHSNFLQPTSSYPHKQLYFAVLSQEELTGNRFMFLDWKKLQILPLLLLLH